MFLYRTHRCSPICVETRTAVPNMRFLALLIFMSCVGLSSVLLHGTADVDAYVKRVSLVSGRLCHGLLPTDLPLRPLQAAACALVLLQSAPPRPVATVPQSLPWVRAAEVAGGTRGAGREGDNLEPRWTLSAVSLALRARSCRADSPARTLHTRLGRQQGNRRAALAPLSQRARHHQAHVCTCYCAPPRLLVAGSLPPAFQSISSSTARWSAEPIMFLVY